MACLSDAYKRVDVLGKVHQSALKKYVASLKSRNSGSLGSLSENEDSSCGGTLANEGRTATRNKKGKGEQANLIRIPKELEEFVLPTDPTNIDRTRIALSKPNGKTGEIFKKIAFLTEIYAKQQNNRFARSGIASTGVSIQMGAKTGRGTGFDVKY
eukprot:2385397-Amphidinium_carterae.1